LFGDFMPLYFNALQVPMAKKAFNDAEKLVASQFRLSEQELKKIKYEVKTLAYLNEQEIKDGTFAHLCKYTFEKRMSLTIAAKTDSIFIEYVYRTIIFWTQWKGLILSSN